MKIILLFLAALSGFVDAQSPADLRRALPAAPAAAVLHVDTLALATLPPGTTSTTLTLTATPIAAMGAFVIFTSSQLGGDKTIAVPAIQSTIVFTLPTYTPFTPQDVVTVAYWAAK